MIAQTNIVASLNSLERSYNNAANLRSTHFYSKLALLELCGWIEESMDDIVLRCARRHLKDRKNIKFVADQTIKRTYGFEYEKHFRKMLIHLFGIINTEKLERKVDQRKWQLFKAALNNLKTKRNTEAHTHIKGAMRHIDAPSITIAQFPALYDGLIEFDTTIKRMKFK